MNVIDFNIKTALNSRRDKPLVFTTSKTLHERFTPEESPCVFIVKCGYIPPSQFSGTKERVVFCDRRSVDVHERFTSYRRDSWREMDKSRKRIEDRKRLEQELGLMAKKRRTVVVPKPSEAKQLTKVSNSRPEKRVGALESSKNIRSPARNSYFSTPANSVSSKNTRSPVRNSYFSTPVNNSVLSKNTCSPERNSHFGAPVNSVLSKYNDKFNYFSKPNDNKSSYFSKQDDDSLGFFRKRDDNNLGYFSKKTDKFSYFNKQDEYDKFNLTIGSFDANGYYSAPPRPMRYSWYDRDRQDDYTPRYREILKNSDGHDFRRGRRIESIVTSPYHYFARRQSLYRWRREPLTKEQLDDELDRYMSEVKFKSPLARVEEDDIDSFVDEYMMETEKFLNQPGAVITLD